MNNQEIEQIGDENPIDQENVKNVTSKPSNSPKKDVSLSKQQNSGEPLSDTQQQEAVPQFSTNSDQNPSNSQLNNLVPNQNEIVNPLILGKSNGFVTKFGRQLSGNHDLELNFKKKSNHVNDQINSQKMSFKGTRLSQGGYSDKLSSIEQQPFQRNPTMRIKKNLDNMAPFQNICNPKLSQQKTIRLNFFDDLQIGFENNDQQNINYDGISNGVINQGKPDKWFQDPNFSVIYKNPKGSDFLDHGDYEDEKMYESRDLDSPQILESARNFQNNLKQTNFTQSPALQKSSVKDTPIFMNDPSSVNFKMQNNIDRVAHVFIEEYHNCELDVAEIHQKSSTLKNIEENYNTQNKDSEIDDFLPKYNLLSKNQTLQINHHLLKPKVKNNRKKRKTQGILENRQRNDQSLIDRHKKRLENSVLNINMDQDNSDIFKRLENDINEKPQYDDKRAKMMAVNNLMKMRIERTPLDNSFLMIVDKLPIERVDDMEGSFIKVKKIMCITRININHLAFYIIKSRLFEAISLMVITANSVTLAIEDPTSSTTKPYQTTMDTLFLALYTIEMALKIIGLGFIFNRGAYLRDAWNILDFIIVMTAYLPLILQGGSLNLSGLRAFRVLRPLKSISSIDGLKVIVQALIASMPLLLDTIIVLFFFFFIFAIAGLQLFSGYMKNRCINIETGVPNIDDKFCGYRDCDPGYFCGKTNTNPNYDQSNFDTIFYSLIAIFTSVTLEGWTSLMFAIDESFTNLAFIFFIPLVFIGAFFLMNLTLAVIKSKFTKQHADRKLEKIKGLTNKKVLADDYVTYDHLKDKEKKQRDDDEHELRNKILRKWRMILFIKMRIRLRIRQFRERKENDTHNKNKTTASTGLENGPNALAYDYGHLFSPIDQNNDVESQQNFSVGLDLETQQSQRQLLSSQNRNNQQIQLVQLSNDDRGIKIGNKINIYNLRQLDQDAIEEEDDEYKTEFSNIIANNRHFSNHRLSSKNIRNGSYGSKSTPKSGAHNDYIEGRRMSSQGINFQNQIQFIQSTQNQKPHMEGIYIQSPGKKIKLVGMQTLKNIDKSKKKESQKNLSNSKQRRTSKKIDVDDQFFVDFVNNDLELLEQFFTEEQLLDIAKQIDDPQNKNNSSKILDLSEADIQGQQFSEISILTEDFNNRRPNIQPQIKLDEDFNEDKNQTPYTNATGQFAKSGNNFYRQRTKNTNHYFISQDLSISQDFEMDDLDKVKNGGDNYQKNNESPQTYQSISNDVMNSNEIPLNLQITDFSGDRNHDPLRENLAGYNNAYGRNAKKTESTATNPQNLSQSNLTTIYQNGTIHSDINPLMIGGYKTKDKEVVMNGKRKFMGSSKIVPFELSSFDPKTIDKIIKVKHGPNTISNQDEITIDKSVLNSRFLISNNLQKHQKVYLRKEKFDFTKQSEDIFEQRDHKTKERIIEEKRVIATSYSKNIKIKPYQKKVTYQPKIFKPDEDQIEYLQHLGLEPGELIVLIQQQYNEPYITNTYVTGTLSIAIHDKKDVRTNKTRKIQNVYLKQENNEEQVNESMNQSMSVFNGGQGTNNSIHTLSPFKKSKTLFQTRKKNLKILTAKEQFNTDIKTEIFMKATSNPIMSKSTKRYQVNQSLMQEIKKRIGHTNETNVIDSTAKRELLLKKAAAKDPQLQKKLLLSAMNRDALNSNVFGALIKQRKNRITDEEVEKNPNLKGMLDIYKDEEEEEEEEEEQDEDEASDDDNIKDDFLDWPIDCRVEILKAKKKALSGKKNIVQWSGQDVLTDFDPQHAHSAISQISLTRIWPKFIYGIWKQFKVPLKRFVKGSFFDNFMTAAVFVNTIALALDKYGISATDQANLSTMNTIFTWIFICEMSCKIVGLGPIKYFKDKMNYLDCMVVILSIVEMTILSNSGTNLSAFRSIRIFRTFRVLRVARLLRSMKSMQVIISVLVRSMDSFIYLALLLMLFIFIYALLGMQIFGGNYNFDSNFSDPPGVPRTNYNNFNSAFLTTFQILTLESWPSLFYDALRSGVIKPISALYFISWVFLGNFMLLNLFLAILLDSFTEEAPQKNEVEDSEKVLKMKHLQMLEKKEGQELIEYYQETKDQGGNDKQQKGAIGGAKKKKKKKKKDENMLDESFEFTKEALTKKIVTKKMKVDFEGVECEQSFYFLQKSYRVRLYLYKMVTHTGFETIILILIILSSIKLVIDTYIYELPTDDPILVASQNIDYFFTGVFAMESVLKSFAFGFIQDKGSYLRETWSQLDFFIVTTSLIDASFESVNLPIIKILRLLRTLRPLRFISHNSGMKTIVVALLGSVSGIFNVLIVVVVVWMMFAILAVNFFGGKMQYCTENPYIYHNQAECLRNRGQWKTQDYNFDNVPQAMITLFALATLENWPDIMYNTINSQGVDIGPAINASPLNGYFFVVYILIGSFLFLNLFVGVIFKEFEDAQQEEKASLMLKEEQMKWVDMMKMIVNSNPDLETTNRPKQKWRAAIHGFMTGANRPINYVDIFIMTCIVLNMFQMAISYEGSSLKYNTLLDYVNYFFTSVFALECILKLLSFGKSYFKTSWNIFDFCVVVASFMDIVMNQSTNSLQFLKVGPQIARVMRVMRVSRLFRLINKYKGLQALIQTITFSLPSLFNVFSLLMLVYFIFAVLANFLFRAVTEGYMIDQNTNFINFSNSMLTMIRMSTGEDWIYIMYDCMRTESDNCVPGKTCGVNYAPVFFIPYIMLTQFIMLNLFIMVIIQQFELYYLQDDNVLEKFKNNLIVFKKNWTIFTKDHDCLKLKDTRLVAFFRAMDQPLGMKGKSDKDIIKDVVLMELHSDEDGFVYFNELLYRTMRREYGETHVKNKILVDHELRTMQKIEAIKQKMQKKSWKHERTQAAQVNPFMLQMYMNISFKAWLNQFRVNSEKREAEKEYLQAHTNMDNFDLLSEDSHSDQKSQKELEEWYYLTDQDIECSSDEESYYEEDSNDDDEGDQRNDSSRMLRQKHIDIQNFKQNKTKLEGILKQTKKQSGSNYSSSQKSVNSDQIPSYVQNTLQNENQVRRVSNRSNLFIEVPKKRISNSQQPPMSRVTSGKQNSTNANINNQLQQLEQQLSMQPDHHQFKFDIDKINQQQQQVRSPQPFQIREQNPLGNGIGYSTRRKDNVIVSSRSGSNGDYKEGDSLNEDRDGYENDQMGRSLKEEGHNDQIVLLKINMNNQNQK